MLAHVPVLLDEVVEMLSPRNGGVYFDGTFGGGGYTRSILESAKCTVVGCDRDQRVLCAANELREKYGNNFKFSHAKFSDVEQILKNYAIAKLDGIVLDLGVSNFQLNDPSRGFSFRHSGPLSMEMGLCRKSAMDIIHEYSEQQLADIIYEYGEERFSRKIAKNIKKNLEKIKNTEDFANIIRICVKKTGRTDPATKTFQAIRICVNEELVELKAILDLLPILLNPGGRVVVVSFHSLEDRIIKTHFKQLCDDKNCADHRFCLLTKKPLIPSRSEVLANPKSRSAKLRGICKV
ncbi:MAG: 16S rRNA (cytosine(1402)-N(4))-methyltransferase RsmH [Holosporaceae bacterium]|jgi:16S rRNA (cytosine1402-N4)-methyltransferase|nr:16S rRNA (cytosine(1402)-N(4))-methyltransferase RsmH [Holosporaceae bacterium]